MIEDVFLMAEADMRNLSVRTNLDGAKRSLLHRAIYRMTQEPESIFTIPRIIQSLIITTGVSVKKSISFCAIRFSPSNTTNFLGSM